MTKEEVAQILDDFISEHGMWNIFEEWLENKGYTLRELGLPEE